MSAAMEQGDKRDGWELIYTEVEETGKYHWDVVTKEHILSADRGEIRTAMRDITSSGICEEIWNELCREYDEDDDEGLEQAYQEKKQKLRDDIDCWVGRTSFVIETRDHLDVPALGPACRLTVEPVTLEAIVTWKKVGNGHSIPVKSATKQA